MKTTNSPGVSKALRLLERNGLVERTGRGGKGSPFLWRVRTTPGLSRHTSACMKVHNGCPALKKPKKADLLQFSFLLEVC